MTANNQEAGAQRVQDAARRQRAPGPSRRRRSISAVLSDPGVQAARAGAAKKELGLKLCARLQPFQERYDEAVRDR